MPRPGACTRGVRKSTVKTSQRPSAASRQPAANGAPLGHPYGSQSDPQGTPALGHPYGSQSDPQGTQNRRHIPVFRAEVVSALARPAAILIDATIGDGGHAASLLAASGPKARLLGVDLDPAALHEAGHVLEAYGDRVRLVHGTFADIQRIAEEAGFGDATGIVFDLGLRSSLLDQDRGFSFRGSSRLDMRFDSRGQIRLPEPSHSGLRRLARQRGNYTAAEVLRFLSAKDLGDLLRQYGDEHAARKISEGIVTTRRERDIASTSDLVSVVIRSLPPRARHGRIHAATKTFQALRIAVNREFESLEIGLRGALSLLGAGGRLAVSAYHSGEDRIVKRVFREAVSSGHFAHMTKRPLTPTDREQQENPRGRSAKLRILEHTSTP